MIILLDTSTPVCKLTLVDDEQRYDHTWQADRSLAKGLLEYISDRVGEHKKSWADITGIGVFAGPGSFTGLRIGLTVMNTVADSEKIPIVGGRGDGWQNEVLAKLKTGENEKIVLPYYGGDAHITAPRK